VCVCVCVVCVCVCVVCVCVCGVCVCVVCVCVCVWCVCVCVCVCEAIYGNWSIACDSWNYLAQYQIHYKYSNSLDIFGFVFRIKVLENRCCLCLCNLLWIIPRKTYLAFYITTRIVYDVDNASWKLTMKKCKRWNFELNFIRENRTYLNFIINFVIQV